MLEQPHGKGSGGWHDSGSPPAWDKFRGYPANLDSIQRAAPELLESSSMTAPAVHRVAGVAAEQPWTAAILGEQRGLVYAATEHT